MPILDTPRVRIDILLAQPAEAESDLATALQSLYQHRYTGPITVHFSAGIPRLIELPAPKVKLRT
jgi:hypothetical protein